MRHDPTLLVEDAMPGEDFLLGHLAAGPARLQVLRIVLGNEGADFIAKREVLRRETHIHRNVLLFGGKRNQCFRITADFYARKGRRDQDARPLILAVILAALRLVARPAAVRGETGSCAQTPRLPLRQVALEATNRAQSSPACVRVAMPEWAAAADLTRLMAKAAPVPSSSASPRSSSGSLPSASSNMSCATEPERCAARQ